MSARRTPDPEHRFGSLLTELSFLLRREFERRLRRQAIGLTRAQWRLLLYLSDREGCSQSALASTLRQKPATIGRHVGLLESAGWIGRARDRRDGRARRLTLQPKARRTLGRMHRIAARLRTEYFGGLPAGRADRLMADLLRIKRNLLALDAGTRGTSAHEKN